MASVVSFRPSDEEEEIVERTRRSFGLKTRSEAVRFLVRRGAERVPPLSEDPIFKFRVPEKYRHRRTVSSQEIDDAVSGRQPA